MLEILNPFLLILRLIYKFYILLLHIRRYIGFLTREILNVGLNIPQLFAFLWREFQCWSSQTFSFITFLPPYLFSVLRANPRRVFLSIIVLGVSALHIFIVFRDKNKASPPRKRKSEPKSLRKRKRFSMPNGSTPISNRAPIDLLKYDISMSSLNIPSDWEQLPRDQRELLTAIRQHQMEEVYVYKEKGLSLTFEENMPWREAILSNNLLCVRFLVAECGIDVNCELGFGVRWASCKGHIDLVEQLFDFGVDAGVNNYEALSIAKKSGKSIERKLGAYLAGNRKTLSLEQKNQLLHYLDEQNLKELKRIYDSNPNFDWTSSGHFILREAVLSGKLEVVRFLFENVGMEVDAEAGFALRYASKLGLTALVDYLLNRNAVVESRNREAYRWALHMGHEDIASLLESHDPDPSYNRHRDEFHLEENTYRWQSPGHKRMPHHIRDMTPFTTKIVNEIDVDSDDEYMLRLRRQNNPLYNRVPGVQRNRLETPTFLRPKE